MLTADVSFYGVCVPESVVTGPDFLVECAKASGVQKTDEELQAKADKIWAKIQRCVTNGGIRPREDFPLPDIDDWD